MLTPNNLYKGDCLELMKSIPPHSVDMVLCDLPYGTTKCKWDTPIDITKLWDLYSQAVKPSGAIVLFGAQPFSSVLVQSNLKDFRYEWIWDKVTARGHLVAKKRPMCQHENLLVFYKQAPEYIPQMVLRDKPIRGKEGKRTEIMGGESTGYTKVYTHAYPKTIITCPPDKNIGHPTQKPVDLCKYLIETYTNPGELILDNCAGSGTTGVACIRSRRQYLLIEQELEYCKIAKERLLKEQEVLNANG